MNTARHGLWLAGLVALGASAGVGGCGSQRDRGFLAGSQGDDGGGGFGDDGGFGTFNADGGPTDPGKCTGLQCQIHACGGGGGKTTISGKVFDPAGKNPLYDIVVFVPNAPLKPFPSGAGCYSCSDLVSGDPVATALTDASGSFTIPEAPDGSNIPIVVQIGKWRKQTTIPVVAPCTDNKLPDGSLRLPRNHGEGDIPNIAISTGGYDSLECLLTRVGVDTSEYAVGASSSGRIHIFAGSGKAGGGPAVPDTSPAAPASHVGLWDSMADLMNYDVVLLSCEGQETLNMNQQALFDYAAAGGRVFGSHFHYSWFDTGPFGSANLAKWTTGTSNIGDINATIVTTLFNGQAFPKGLAMQQWLGNVGALGVGGAPPGELPVRAARHNADVSVVNTPSQPWILTDQSSSPPGAAEYFSFDTPIGVPSDKQCGRVVFSDLHVGAHAGDYPGGSFIVPSGCAAADLSPQEKALEFMLFDLSSCFTPIDLPPQPPPPIPPQ
jgi:hypothetical protein